MASVLTRPVEPVESGCSFHQIWKTEDLLVETRGYLRP
jgi:hypothetical protein